MCQALGSTDGSETSESGSCLEHCCSCSERRPGYVQAAMPSDLLDGLTLTLSSDLDTRGQRHRHRYFRKSRGSSGVKGAELLIPPPNSYGASSPSGLPPRFQAAAPRPPPPPSPGALTYDPYVTHHRQVPPTARPSRYGAAR